MLRRAFMCLSLLGFALVFSSRAALAQYQLTVLDSNQEGKSVQPPDPLLVNAWGLARGDTSGKVIHIDQLWAIDFGGGGSTPSGSANTLFFTAGPDNNLAGEFGEIVFK